MMKTVAMMLGLALVLVAGDAQAASTVAKRFDAGPAIQGNSQQLMPKKKATKHMPPKKAM